MLNKNKSIIYTALLSLLVLSGCEDIDNTGANIVNADSGLVSAEVIDDINASTMLAVVKASVDANAANAFGYKAVKIVYKTKDMDGDDVNASGLLVIPSATDEYQAYRAANGELPFSVSMICDNHGTIFTNAEAPSNLEVANGLPDYTLAVLMSAYAGFASVMPDYVGYGSSNASDHPYLLKELSAQNSLDMIKASMKYMEQNGVVLNYQLYVSGYSQGGHVAMALAQKIEKTTDMVDLKGVAPMAGPYLISSFGDSVLASDANMSVPAFMGYIADSYSNYYDDINLSYLLVDSKEAAFDGLFDGSNDITTIHTALGLPLGAPTTALFDSTFVSDYESTPTHELRARFIENNVGAWAAKSKINLIHCDNDDVVPYAMSAGIEQILDSYGAEDVTLTPISTVPAGNVHSDCAIPAYQQALGWFDAIRQGQI